MLNILSYSSIINKKPQLGQIHKTQSDMIMDATWNTDISSRVAYMYDFYHDEQPTEFLNLSAYGTPVEIKFLANTYNSENKDIQGFHIQFRPNHECPLEYYQEYVEKWGNEYPVGLYLSIPDERGKLRKWLVTEPANNLGTQFPTWYVLPVDHVLQWIANGKAYEMCCVLRSQNSYNSGVWSEYRLETVENQRKVALPMNDISKTIFYNTRIAISEPIDEPVVWRCTKVEQTSPKGTNRLTFAQDHWNPNRDAINPTEDLTGIWCDYYTENGTTAIDDVAIPETPTYGIISCSGSQEIKAGGSYKKLSVSYFMEDEEIEVPEGHWEFNVDDEDVSAYITTSTTGLEANQLKIKFANDGSFIRKTLVIQYVPDIGEIAELNISIVSL